ncbi:MAG: hypothetical protein FWE37_08055 [Spirochaetaceae bacterium]|nr:hypothetical protein [Spirochaetaceae bacterium]
MQQYTIKNYRYPLLKFIAPAGLFGLGILILVFVSPLAGWAIWPLVIAAIILTEIGVSKFICQQWQITLKEQAIHLNINGNEKIIYYRDMRGLKFSHSSAARWSITDVHYRSHANIYAIPTVLSSSYQLKWGDAEGNLFHIVVFKGILKKERLNAKTLLKFYEDLELARVSQTDSKYNHQ